MKTKLLRSVKNGSAFWRSSTDLNTTTITPRPEGMSRSIEWLSTERGEVYIRCAGQIFSRHDDRFDDGRRSLSEKQDELYESVYEYGDSINDYAHDSGIDQSTASKRNRTVIKKFKKVFE